MEHYFREKEPQVFNENDDEAQIEDYFDNIIEKINGKIEAWVENRSGWEIEKMSLCTLILRVFSHCEEGLICHFRKS